MFYKNDVGFSCPAYYYVWEIINENCNAKVKPPRTSDWIVLLMFKYALLKVPLSI